MKEIAMYGYGSFNDYKGQEHKIIVCALSRRANVNNSIEVPPVTVYANENDDWGIQSSVAKVLSFGVAICNPIDAYDKEHGEIIAYNRAKSEDAAVLTSSRAGFFNTTTVTAILNNYIDYIQKDPGSAIAGYDQAKEKFYEEQDLKNDVSKMTEDEKSKIKILATSAPENIEYAKKVIKFIK